MAELKRVPVPPQGFRIRNQSQLGRVRTDNCWGNALGNMLHAASDGLIDFPRDATALRDTFDLAPTGGLGQGDLKKICAHLRKLEPHYPEYKLDFSPPPFGARIATDELRRRLSLGAVAVAFIDYGRLPRSPFRGRAPSFYDSDQLGDDVGHVVALSDFDPVKRQYRLFDPLDAEGSDGDIVKAADVERAIKKHIVGGQTLLSVGTTQWRNEAPVSVPTPQTGGMLVIEIDRFPTNRQLTIPPRPAAYEIPGLAIDRAMGSLKPGAKGQLITRAGLPEPE